MSISLQAHGLEHTRSSCPSLSPRVCQVHDVHSIGGCHPTISSSVTLFFFCLLSPSIKVFSNESVLHITWPKYWSFSFSISPSNEYLELISFRIYWIDLLVVQGTLKSIFQHHSSKASILQCPTLFMVQLPHP